MAKKHDGMMQRVKGKNKIAKTSVGKPIISKKDFVEWGINEVSFNALFDAWIESGYQIRLIPSIDRVNPCLGYTLDNMQFITYGINSKKDRVREFILVSPDGVIVRGKNVAEFCRSNGLNRGNVSSLLNGNALSVKGWTNFTEGDSYESLT